MFKPLTIQQQMQLNSIQYDSEEVAKKYTKKQLATVVVATTNWSESIYQQYKEFENKEAMVDYIIYWLDDIDGDDFDEVHEDLITFIDNHKD